MVLLPVAEFRTKVLLYHEFIAFFHPAKLFSAFVIVFEKPPAMKELSHDVIVFVSHPAMIAWIEVEIWFVFPPITAELFASFFISLFPPPSKNAPLELVIMFLLLHPMMAEPLPSKI